jgi:hypothetical protein
MDVRIRRRESGLQLVGHDIGLMVAGRRSRAGSNPSSTMARYRKLAHVGT